jgi:ABC-type transport system substrate-binding protein
MNPSVPGKVDTRRPDGSFLTLGGSFGAAGLLAAPSRTSYWGTPTFEEAYRCSRRELDPQQRLDYPQQAVAAMREDPPCLFMIQTVSIWANTRTVQNFAGTASGYIWHDDIRIVRP